MPLAINDWQNGSSDGDIANAVNWQLGHLPTGVEVAGFPLGVGGPTQDTTGDARTWAGLNALSADYQLDPGIGWSANLTIAAGGIVQIGHDDSAITQSFNADMSAAASVVVWNTTLISELTGAAELRGTSVFHGVSSAGSISFHGTALSDGASLNADASFYDASGVAGGPVAGGTLLWASSGTLNASSSMLQIAPSSLVLQADMRVDLSGNSGVFFNPTVSVTDNGHRILIALTGVAAGAARDIMASWPASSGGGPRLSRGINR